jgi:hypothetical protein
MKNLHLLASGAVFAALLLAGCGHLDLAAPGDPSRVAVGMVVISTPIPDDAEVLVRVMNPHPQVLSAGSAMPGQMPLLNQPVTATASAAAAAAPEELGEQIIKHPVVVVDPVSKIRGVAYRVEYQADDDTLRRGLNIEVRISYNGRVQLFNSNQYSITLPDVKDPHEVEADQMR